MFKIIHDVAYAAAWLLSCVMPGCVPVKKVEVVKDPVVAQESLAKQSQEREESVAPLSVERLVKEGSAAQSFEARLVMRLVKGDITQQRFDKSKKNTIVSAANASMDYDTAGGVAGAIGNIAGRAVLTKALAEKGCKPGCAVVSNGFGFAPRGVDSIIHAVGPDCRKPEECKNRIRLLSDVYKNIFKQAEAIGTQVLYIPAISTAIFGCDKHEATTIALQEASKLVSTVTSDKQVFEIVFVVFDQEMYDMYIKCSMQQGLDFK